MKTALRACVAALLMVAAGPAAENRWLRLRSANFEMYTSGPARTARETLVNFERVRGFLLKALGWKQADPPPVRLVVFGSEREFAPFRPVGFAAAYYQPANGRDYIGMGQRQAGTFRLAVHEYVHLVIKRSGLALPPWANEGLADLYSTLQPRGNQMLVGEPVPGRREALLEEHWVPLETILRATKDSPYYNRKEKAGAFYNESWALMHMLRFEARYRAGFHGLLAAIAGAGDSAQALQQIYGRPVEQVERDLREYLSSYFFQGVLEPAAGGNAAGGISAAALADFDAGLMLADLLYGAGKEAEQRAALERLARQEPKRPEPHRELGYLAWRAGPRGEALPQFDQAFALGDGDPKFLLDYARLLAGSRDAQAIRILSGLLAREPGSVEIRLELADAQLREDNARGALETLRELAGLTHSYPPRYFRIAGEAHLREGEASSALEAAMRLREAARTEEERTEADLLAREAAQGASVPSAPPRAR